MDENFFSLCSISVRKRGWVGRMKETRDTEQGKANTATRGLGLRKCESRNYLDHD